MTIDVVFRNEKGDELTWEEMDANLANLQVAIETKKDNFSILPVAQGGTGVATIAEAKQILGIDYINNIIESINEKLLETKRITDYSGATTNAKVQAMISDVGYAIFPPGEHVVTTDTFDAPLVFDVGAYLTVNTGNTLTITNRVESIRQWIFRGAGDYVLGNDSDSGEDARELHISWFGAFPGGWKVDCSAKLNKAYAAVGNLRESVIKYDIGTYWIGAGVTVTRGAHTKGDGTRRTVFRQYADGFDVFTTSGVAAKFSDIQFENIDIGSFNGKYINIAHSECEVYYTNIQSSTHGIYITGANCRVDNIMLTVGDAPAAGSSAVRVMASGCSISNIMANTSALGPDAIVHIGGSATVSNTKVANISTVLPSIPVLVDATAGSVVRAKIDGIGYEQTSGTAAAYLLKFITGSTYSLTDIVVSNIVGNSYSTNGIRLEQNSSGVMEDISFDNITISGATGNGFEFVRTAGTLRDVRIGTNVDVSERATPYFYSGTTSGFKIEPNALPNTLPAYCYDFTIADDGFSKINLNRSVFSGWLMISVANADRGIYTFRAAPTPSIVAYGTPSTNMNTATTSLNGTTGTDAKFTIGVIDGEIYLENRLGSAQRVSVSVLSGA